MQNLTNNQLLANHKAAEFLIARVVGNIHGVLSSADIERRDNCETELKRRRINIPNYRIEDFG